MQGTVGNGSKGLGEGSWVVFGCLEGTGGFVCGSGELTIDDHGDIPEIDLASGLNACLTAVFALV